MSRMSRTRSSASRGRTKFLIYTMLAALPQQRFLMPPLGPFQGLFLIAVVELGPDNAYGLRIAEWLENELGRNINIGQIYNTAEALKDQNLISPETKPNPTGVGRSVVVYTLTSDGEAMLDAVQSFHAGRA